MTFLCVSSSSAMVPSFSLANALEESNEGINYTMKKTRRTDPALSSALQRLKAQRRELDQTIRELEEMINDPDMDF